MYLRGRVTLNVLISLISILNKVHDSSTDLETKIQGLGRQRSQQNACLTNIKTQYIPRTHRSQAW